MQYDPPIVFYIKQLFTFPLNQVQINSNYYYFEKIEQLPQFELYNNNMLTQRTEKLYNQIRKLFYLVTKNTHCDEFPNFTQKLITLQSNSEKSMIEVELTSSSQQQNWNDNKQMNLLLFHLLFENHQISAFIYYIKAYNIIETSQLAQLIDSVDSQALFCQIILQKRYLNWQLYVLLGEYLARREMHKEARMLFRHAIDLNSSCHYAYNGLAFLAMVEQKHYYFSRYMECAIKLGQQFISYYYHYSFILTMKGLNEQSNSILELALKNTEPSPLIYAQMAINYFQLLKYAKSLQYAIKAIELCEDRYNMEHIYLISAKILLNTNKFDQSWKIIDQFCQLFPNKYQWQMLKGDYYLVNNELEAATESYNKALESISDKINARKQQERKNVQNKMEQQLHLQDYSGNKLEHECYNIMYSVSQAYLYLQDYSNCLFYAIKLLQSPCQKQKFNAYINIAQVYLKQDENYQEIKLFCQKAQQCYVNQDQDQDKIRLAFLYISLDEIQKCDQILKSCCNHFSSGDKLYLQIIVLFGLNKYKQAINLGEKLIQQGRTQWKIYLGLGQIYLHLKDYEKAIKYLQQSLELSKDLTDFEIKRAHSNIYSFLGNACLSLRKFQLGMKYLSIAIKFQPKNYLNYFYSAKIYENKREYNEALKVCLKYIQQNPSASQLYYTSGCNQIQLCLYQQALKHFLKLIQAKQDIHLAYEGIGFLQFKRKKYQKSSELFMRSIRNTSTHSQAYLGLSALYNCNEVSQKIKSQIMVFIAKIEQSPSINLVIYYNLSSFYLLIKQYHKSSELFWIMFKPLKEEYERENEISYNSKQFVYDCLNYRFKDKARQYYHLNNFLLFKVMGEVDYCQEILKLMLLNIDKPNQIEKLVKSNHPQYKQICFEFLVDEMFKIDHQLGADAYLQVSKLQFIEKSWLDKYVTRSLHEAILQISQISKILSELSFENLDSPISCSFKQISQIKNLKQMLKLSQQLRAYQEEQSIPLGSDLAIILDKINQQKDINKVIESIIKTVKVSKKKYDFFGVKKLFVLIQQKAKDLQKRLRNIIKTYKQEKDLRKLCKGINKIMGTLLSEKYRKNEVIKLIWQKTYFLADLLKGKLDQLTDFLQKFRQKSKLNLSNLEDKLMRLFFPEENLNQSKSEMNFDLDRQKNENSESYKNEILDLSQIQSSFVQPHNSNNEHVCQSLIGQKIHKKTYSESDIKLTKKGQLKQPAEQSFQTIKELPQQDKTNLLTFCIFKNHYDLMHDLSNRQLPKDHIAKYHLHTKWRPEFAEEKKFTYEMEEGEAIWKRQQKLLNKQLMKKCIEQSQTILPRIFQRGELQKLQDIKIIDYLWREGEKEILKYIICLVKGINELEELKIAHLDIEFRNVIKVNSVHKSVYKLMDLDIALSYGRTQVNEETFENTLAIFRVIASYSSKSNVDQSGAQMRAIQFVFRDLDKKRRDELLGMLERDGDLQNKVQKLLIAFEQYAKEYHLRQFERMMKFLVVKQILGSYPKINTWVNCYCRGKIDSQKLLKKLDVLCR